MIDSGWRHRWTDYEFLISPQARELLQQERIAVIDYRPIQQAWSQPSAPWQTLREHAQRYSTSCLRRAAPAYRIALSAAEADESWAQRR